jgi:hypothetical protein
MQFDATDMLHGSPPLLSPIAHILGDDMGNFMEAWHVRHHQTALNCFVQIAFSPLVVTLGPETLMILLQAE